MDVLGHFFETFCFIFRFTMLYTVRKDSCPFRPKNEIQQNTPSLYLLPRRKSCLANRYFVHANLTDSLDPMSMEQDRTMPHESRAVRLSRTGTLELPPRLLLVGVSLGERLPYLTPLPLPETSASIKTHDTRRESLVWLYYYRNGT
jgi:hypothetical protein